MPAIYESGSVGSLLGMCVGRDWMDAFGSVSTSDLVLFAQCLILAVQLWLIFRQLKVSEGAERRAQRHDMLSVRPYLDFPSSVGKGFLKIVLVNHGSGVAILTSFTLRVDGHEMPPPNKGDRLKAFQDSLGLPDEALDPHSLPTVTWGDCPAGLKPGGETPIVDIPLRGDIDMRMLRSRISIQIRYKSLYDEEFECQASWPPP